MRTPKWYALKGTVRNLVLQVYTDSSVSGYESWANNAVSAACDTDPSSVEREWLHGGRE